MLIEIFEQVEIKSEASDLDLMVDYIVDYLRENGAEVKRFDPLSSPNEFERVKEYALPVIMRDNEIISAGSYDFSEIGLDNFNLNQGSCCTLNKCVHCSSKDFCKRRLS